MIDMRGDQRKLHGLTQRKQQRGGVGAAGDRYEKRSANSVRLEEAAQRVDNHVISVAQAAVPHLVVHKKQGFTIIELLVVIGIIGIIVAAAVWNYYMSIHRARQKKTMADIRSIATAWEARATDVKAYNAAAIGFTWPGAPITISDMNTMLVPTYIKVLPQLDGWGRAFSFAASQPVGSANVADDYAVRSAGRDGIFSTSYVPGGTTDFDCDIVYSGGVFIVYPEGLQR